MGLPRTGTTSFCAATLDLGFPTAHTAYTDKAIKKATVIADAPVFCDYPNLYEQYPTAKFILLHRDSRLWIPSIRQLLLRMHTNVTRNDGGFSPTIKRVYTTVFSPFTIENINSDSFLIDCYQQHSKQLRDFCDINKVPLLELDISEEGSEQALIDFLAIKALPFSFPHLNKAGKVIYWNKIKHPLKVNALEK